jgi:predicted secreted protein
VAAAIDCDRRDNGRSVVLPPDSELRIALEANRSTGYGWRLASGGAPQLELVGQAYALRPEAQDLDGVGGTAHWRFRAALPGTAEVRLEYVRDGETASPPVTVYLLRVTVAP